MHDETRKLTLILFGRLLYLELYKGPQLLVTFPLCLEDITDSERILSRQEPINLSISAREVVQPQDYHAYLYIQKRCAGPRGTGGELRQNGPRQIQA